MELALAPKIWGPHYWFVLNTIAFSYPITPNKVTKKKYYDFIMNLPLLLPTSEIGSNFSKLLDQYPVTPYLDSRPSFIKWIHFIHNRINEGLNKSIISYKKFVEDYYENYKEDTKREDEKKKAKTYYVYIIFLIIIFFIIVYLYNQ